MLLYTQVKIVMKKMFDIIHMSRYYHLVSNGGSKVWSKQTAQTAVPYRQKMLCPISGPFMSGSNCPIKEWSNKKMFMAHWQIYHIDMSVA